MEQKMSKFLEETKHDEESNNQTIVNQLKAIERQRENPQSSNKFNFMVDVAKGINDGRRALRAYHWLYKCQAIKRNPDSVMMYYSDLIHATWALNYIREGVMKHFKTQNVYTVYDGRIIDGTTPPDRKNGDVEVLAKVNNGITKIN